MPAPLDVNRDEVKMLALAIGLRPAAKKLGIPVPTLAAWSSKGKWFAKPEHIQPPTLKPVQTLQTTPAKELQSALADDSKQTRLSLSRAARKAAKTLEDAPGSAVVKQAQNMRHIAATAAQVHSWDQQRASSGPVTLNIMADNAAVQVLHSPDSSRVSDS